MDHPLIFSYNISLEAFIKNIVTILPGRGKLRLCLHKTFSTLQTLALLLALCAEANS